MRSEQHYPHLIPSTEAAYVNRSVERVHRLLLIYLRKMEK